MYLNFIFQGCQKLYVRVAISQKANKIDFQHINKIIVCMITYNATILLVLVDFFSLDYIWAEVHALWRNSNQNSKGSLIVSLLQVPDRVPPLLRLLAQVDEQLVHLHHRQLLRRLQPAKIFRALYRLGCSKSDIREHLHTTSTVSGGINTPKADDITDK